MEEKEKEEGDVIMKNWEVRGIENKNESVRDVIKEKGSVRWEEVVVEGGEWYRMII